MRRESCINQQHRPSSLFRFLGDQSGKLTKSGIEQPPVQRGLGRDVSSGLRGCAFGAARHGTQPEAFERNDPCAGHDASRRLVQEHCRAHHLNCLHVGLYADYGEVIWDEHYRVPQDVAGDVCDYPLARNLILLVVAVASEVLVRHVLTGERPDYSVTLRDFSVRPLEH